MKIRTIALVAHDNRKRNLIEWVRFNRGTLENYRLICTGTTGRLVQEALEASESDNVPVSEPKNLNITRLKSGPLGGDQQLGALIAEGEIDMIVFFWDPMQQQPHDVDVKALLRISNLYNLQPLQHPYCLQPQHRRFPHILTIVQRRLRPDSDRLLRLPQPGA